MRFTASVSVIGLASVPRFVAMPVGETYNVSAPPDEEPPELLELEDELEEELEELLLEDDDELEDDELLELLLDDDEELLEELEDPPPADAKTAIDCTSRAVADRHDIVTEPSVCATCVELAEAEDD